MIDITFVNNLSLLFQLLGFIWYLKRWEEVTRFCYQLFFVCSGIIRMRINYPRSLGSWCLKEPAKSLIILLSLYWTLLSSLLYTITVTCYNAIVGPLLKYIEKKKVFTEKEASLVVKDIVSALDFLHKKGSVFNKATTLSLELEDVLPC